MQHAHHIQLCDILSHTITVMRDCTPHAHHTASTSDVAGVGCAIHRVCNPQFPPFAAHAAGVNQHMRYTRDWQPNKTITLHGAVCMIVQMLHGAGCRSRRICTHTVW
jgi:hypothetical protein